MAELSSMIWIEIRKAYRSRMPIWTAVFCLFMPLGIAFLLYIARNPQISETLGLVSAKANLVAYAAADWTAYMTIYGEIIGAGGLILFIMIISWVFGREFADHTVKDILAVPVARAAIILAKYIVTALWSLMMTGVIFIAGLIMGVVIGLPGFSPAVVTNGAILVLIIACMVIIAILPFALFACLGRGYLLPIGLAVLTMMLLNFAQILGVAQYFPWAVPALLAQGKMILSPISYVLVFLTGLAGMLATYLWWMRADQSR